MGMTEFWETTASQRIFGSQDYMSDVRLFLVQNGWPNSTKQKHSQRNESVRSKFKKRRLGYQYGWFFAPIVLVQFHPGCYKLNPFSHCYRAGAGSNIYTLFNGRIQ